MMCLSNMFIKSSCNNKTEITPMVFVNTVQIHYGSACMHALWDFCMHCGIYTCRKFIIIKITT